MYINEANIGANKVNASIKRSIQYKAIIGQGSLNSQAILSITNTSPNEDYKAYLTFSVPKGSRLKQITVNGQRQSIVPAVTDFVIYEAQGFTPPNGLEVEQFERGPLSHISFVATLSKNLKSEIIVEYENGATKQLSSITSYSLLVIKQPGTKPYNVTTSFTYPEDFSPQNANADTYGNNFLEKTETIAKDYLLEFKMQRTP